MSETRKDKKCLICGGEKKPQAIYCLRCNGIMNHLTQIPKAEDKIIEVRKILISEGKLDPAAFGL
jgi:hypothetical protein